jgi:arsenate reductase
MNVEIYHNPSCSMSRNALRLIRETGVEPRIIEYLETPPDRAELMQLLEAARISVPEILRSKESHFADLGLGDNPLPDSALLDALDAHPILMQRPIVVTALGVNVCRPPELVLALLQNAPRPGTKREDGSDFLIDEEIPFSAELIAELTSADASASELTEACTTLRVRTLDGAEIGHAGFQIRGKAAELIAFTVLPAARRAHAGTNMMRLVLRRAYDLGAREMTVTTDRAVEFLAAVGFKPRGTSQSEFVRDLSLQVS